MSAALPSYGAPRLDQGPPLAIPASFFLTAPVAIVAAGVLVLVYGGALQSRWTGPAFAVAHLGTLGLLGATMLGALYQLIPVLGGTPVPGVRLAHAVHALFVGGLAALVARFCGAPPPFGWGGAAALTGAITLFAGPVAVALARAPSRTWPVVGMRAAALALVVALLLGLRLAVPPLSPLRPLWIQVHLTVGLLGWVGGLVAAVAWQLVPMFYLVPAFDRRLPAVVLALQVVGVVGPLGVLALAEAGVDVGSGAALVAAAPAALAVWGIAPAALLHGLVRRKRAGADGSVRFWFAALPVALALGPLALAAWALPDPRWALAFGWLAIWGWAGTIVHGMLTRIVPFLTWFHRFSPLLGKRRVPAMRALYPDVRVRIGLALHVGTTLAGLVAILLRVAWPAGLGLVVTGGWLGWHLVATLRRRP
ncbi:MAG: hypothetical protein Q8P18_06580 [Pseudomonadota bacterium]|nr:hypothetical protein [Pseudomonadota bacterium]